MVEERKKIFEYVNDLIESFDENFFENNKVDVMSFLKNTSNMFFNNEAKIFNELCVRCLSGGLIFSKKTEEIENILDSFNEISPDLKHEKKKKKR